MPAISALICCANSGDSLSAAIDSLTFVDELIIVDSGSKDNTAEIAQARADRYVLEPWRGYSEQKIFGQALCRNDWIFILDGDEEVSPELAREIRHLSEQAFEDNDIIITPRRNWIFGRPARSWWPDWQRRLYHRGRVTWGKEALHDRRRPSSPERMTRLKHPIEHKRVTGETWTDYFGGQRLAHRLPLQAGELIERGKHSSWLDLVFRPPLAFVKSYLLKGGFKDGMQGLLIAQKASVSTQLKYAALWAAEHGHLREPDCSEASEREQADGKESADA